MLQRVGLAVMFASFGLNIAWLARTGLDWYCLPAAIAAWYLVDALSGLVHMLMDFLPCTGGIGLDRMFFYEGDRESEE